MKNVSSLEVNRIYLQTKTPEKTCDTNTMSFVLNHQDHMRENTEQDSNRDSQKA